jgi:hypothetical protein
MTNTMEEVKSILFCRPEVTYQLRERQEKKQNI